MQISPASADMKMRKLGIMPSPPPPPNLDPPPGSGNSPPS
ncbi:hypothetical protein L195_g038859 [Trifolium pratense]|uniref:Uncharacterized protein n=1 Tax=Trifolium pratense TaxID=57577 RepID=A0A2K3LWB9_TRIPR|nr:hypothetical protein L195_g038859 [Trifolium pratense]